MAYILTSPNHHSAEVNAENELINDEPAEVSVKNESSINYEYQPAEVYVENEWIIEEHQPAEVIVENDEHQPADVIAENDEHQPAEVIVGNEWSSDEDQPSEVIVESEWASDEHQPAVENEYSNLGDLSSDEEAEQEFGEGLETQSISEVDSESEYNIEQLEGRYYEYFGDDSLEFEFRVSDGEARKHDDSKICTMKSVQRIVAVNPGYASSTVTFLSELFDFEKDKFYYVIRTNSIVGQITRELLEFFDRKLNMIDASYWEKVAMGLKIIGCLILNTNSPPAAYVDFLSHKNKFISTMIDPTLQKIFANRDFLVKEIIADIIFELLQKDSSGMLWHDSFSKFYVSDNIPFGVMSFITSLGIELIPEHSFKSLKVLFDNMLRDIISSNPVSFTITLNLRRKIMHFYKLWISYCFRFPTLDYLDSSSKKIACIHDPDFSVLGNRFLRKKLMHDFCQLPSEYMPPPEYPLITNYPENIDNSRLSSDSRNDFLTTGPFDDVMNAMSDKIKTKNESRENNLLSYQIKDTRTRNFLSRKTNKQNTSNIPEASPITATASNEGIGIRDFPPPPVVPVPGKVEVVEIRELSPFIDTEWSEETEGKEKIISLSVVHLHCLKENISDRNKDCDKCDDTDDKVSKKRTPSDMNDSDSNVLRNFAIPDFSIEGVCAAYKKFAKKTSNIKYYVNNTANK